MTYTKINRIYNDINESINPDPDPGTIDLQSKSIEITENGDSVITADPNYDGLSSVNLSVNVPIPPSFKIPEYNVSKFNFTAVGVASNVSWYRHFNSNKTVKKVTDDSIDDACYVYQFNNTIILGFGKAPIGSYYTENGGHTSVDSISGQFVKYNNKIISNRYIIYFNNSSTGGYANPCFIYLFGKLINLPS